VHLATTARERRVLGAILLVALLLRVIWCVYAARAPVNLHDPGFYRLFAEQLAHFNGYRLPIDGGKVATAYYPPGYSFSLAPFFWLTPDSWETGVIAALNVVWQLGLITAGFFTARRLARGNPVAGYVAAATLALWPNLVFHTAVALTESLFLVLLAVIVLLAVDAPWDERRWETWRAIAVGALLGAATLVRPVTIPVFPALGVVFLVARFGWKKAIGQAALVTVAAIGVLTPWAIRNAIVMHQVTLSTNTGDNLCMSRRVGGSGGFEFPNDRCLSGPFESLDRPEFETERDTWGRDIAVDFVQEHPGEELHLVFRRLGHTFENDADGIRAAESYGDDPFLSDGTRDVLRTLATTYGALAGLAGVAGLVVLAIRRRPEGLLVVLIGVGMLIPPMVFFGDPRFHVPAVPIAALGAGVLASAIGYRRTTS
jgi:4-amino-4-deoxy-L-arabinose transferase-like glycosyltransferase